MMGSFTVYGQSFLQLKGIIVAEDTEDPLGFTMMQIEGTSIGTVSNEVGVFELNYAAKFIGKRLVLSRIGYHYDTLILPENPVEYLVIRLLAKPVQLKEVTVSPKPLNAKDLMAGAIANIADNYPKDPFILHAFFRDIKKEEGKCVFLLEAATKVYDEDYHKAPRVMKKLLERVAIEEMRCSYNYIGKKEWKQALGRENAIKELLGNNFVRYQYGVFDLDNNYEYAYEGEEMLGDRLIYTVSVPQFPTTTIYIDAESLGIMKFSYQSADTALVEQVSDSTQRFIVDQEIQFEFQPYQGKLYLKYIKAHTAYEERHLQSDSLIHTAALSLSMMVNKIETGAGVEKIKGRRAMNKYKNLEGQIGVYNTDFWKNYNVLKENPLDSILISDLERELSLEQQFPKQKP